MFKKGDVLKLSTRFFKECGHWYKHLDGNTRTIALSDEIGDRVETDLYPNDPWSSWAFELCDSLDEIRVYHKLKLIMSGNSLQD